MKFPVCFGSAVVVSHLSETCRACPGNSDCAHEAMSFLASVPESPLVQQERMRVALCSQAFAGSPSGESRVLKGSRRIELTEQQAQIVAGLGHVVGSLVRQLFEKGWFDFARIELKAGRNPGRNPWQRIFCRELIKGGISRDSLQMAFQTEMKLTPASARVRVSKSVSVFLAGRLVVEMAGRLVVNPN